MVNLILLFRGVQTSENGAFFVPSSRNEHPTSCIWSMSAVVVVQQKQQPTREAHRPISRFSYLRMSAMEKILTTRAGHVAMSAELKNLKSVERPAIIQAVAEAREHGDLSENAEYHSAREKHSFIEGRIKELEGILSLSEVIDPKTLSGTVKFGATVTIVDEDTDEEKTFQIVGQYEADIERGLLNIQSPIARALIGKEDGDSVAVRTPGGDKSYEILKVEFI